MDKNNPSFEDVANEGRLVQSPVYEVGDDIGTSLNLEEPPLDGNEEEQEAPESEFSDAGLIPEEDLQSLKKTKEKKSRHQPKDRRVEQLAYEKGLKEQESLYWQQIASEERARREQSEAQRVQLEEVVKQKDSLSSQNFDRGLDAQVAHIKANLKRAKEEGDLDAEVDLQEALSDLKGQKYAHEVLRYQQAQQPVYQQPVSQEYVPTENPVNLNQFQESPEEREFREWQQENPWFVNNPRLRAEANQLADVLTNKLAFNNQQHLVGTPEFRDTVTNMLREKYGVGPLNQDDSQERSAMSKPHVAPVSRTMTQAAQYAQQNRVQNVRQLTPEQLQAARCLPRRNNNETEADLVKRFMNGLNASTPSDRTGTFSIVIPE